MTPVSYCRPLRNASLLCLFSPLHICSQQRQRTRRFSGKLFARVRKNRSRGQFRQYFFFREREGGQDCPSLERETMRHTHAVPPLTTTNVCLQREREKQNNSVSCVGNSNVSGWSPGQWKTMVHHTRQKSSRQGLESPLASSWLPLLARKGSAHPKPLCWTSLRNNKCSCYCICLSMLPLLKLLPWVFEPNQKLPELARLEFLRYCGTVCICAVKAANAANQEHGAKLRTWMTISGSAVEGLDCERLLPLSKSKAKGVCLDPFCVSCYVT